MVLSIHNNGKLQSEVPHCLRRVFFASHWRFLFSKHYVINPIGFDVPDDSVVLANVRPEKKTYSIEIQRLIQFYNSTEAQQSVDELERIR